MHLRVSALADDPAWERDVELVERKGLGHPDTICHAVSEAFARPNPGSSHALTGDDWTGGDRRVTIGGFEDRTGKS